MRSVPTVMRDLIRQGGPFIGDNAATHSRVTVEQNWRVTRNYHVTTAVPSKKPFRWWQRIDNSQHESELRNVKSVDIDRSLDADAATATITLYNTRMDANTWGGSVGELGDPGYYSWGYGERDAKARWGQQRNAWGNVLIPNALLRVYQGYGGKEKTITQALSDGNLMLTGVFLVDDVRIGTDGLLELHCRDMAKLLIEQQLFPPLLPAAWYPPEYYRWKYIRHTTPAVPFYDYTNPVQSGPGSEGPKYIVDIACSGDKKGYWLVGTDGGVFAFNVPFYGSRGHGSQVDQRMVSMAADPLERGYWLAARDGAVFAFGEVGYHGGLVGTPLAGDIVAIRAHKSGRGYWMLGADGGVFAFGLAVYHGRPTDGSKTYVDMAPTKSGNGYWVLANDGSIYAFGDANYHGGAIVGFDPATGIAGHPTASGYWIATMGGQVFGLGAATRKSPNGAWNPSQLADPIFAISATPSGNGYLLVGGDGGVFSFGDAPFRGSLPGDYTTVERVDGTYKDFARIIKDLLLWSGWLAHDPNEALDADDVYGNIETTGSYSESDLPTDLFDKRPVIDGINAIKEIVGYHFWIDEEGAAIFKSPNWYRYGNILENGSRTNNLPVIDEKFQLTDYTSAYNDRNVRSEIIISSEEPTEGDTTTVTTRWKMESDLLRGMVRPAMWVNEWFVKRSEQERMAERIQDHIEFSLRQGTITCTFNPAIQIDDQVRIYERKTADTFVHYVRGIQTHHDLDTGEFTMTLTTNWLGEDWATGQIPDTPPADSLLPSNALFPSDDLFPVGT